MNIYQNAESEWMITLQLSQLMTSFDIIQEKRDMNVLTES